MKATLEKLLADVKPEKADGTRDYTNFNELVEWYGKQFKAAPKNHSEWFDKFSNRPASEMASRWETIVYLIGIVHRMSNDGYEPFKLLGLTPDEERQFNSICVKIRETIGRNIKPARTTQTKQLYDQIRRLGF